MMSETREQGPSVETAGSAPAANAAPTAGEYVEVYVSPEDMQATAQALLDAAGDDVESVQTISGGFWVPEPVASAAGMVATDDRSVDPERTGDLEAREGSGAVVSADALIAETIASGEVSPQAVGAVFASNSPTGEDLPGGEQPDGGGEGEDETQAEDGQPPEPDAQPEVETQGEGEQEAEQPELPQPEQPDQPEQETEQLRGDDLDRALRQAGLPLSGTANEKRARLASRNR